MRSLAGSNGLTLITVPVFKNVSGTCPVTTCMSKHQNASPDEHSPAKTFMYGGRARTLNGSMRTDALEIVGRGHH